MIKRNGRWKIVHFSQVSPQTELPTIDMGKKANYATKLSPRHGSPPTAPQTPWQRLPPDTCRQPAPYRKRLPCETVPAAHSPLSSTRLYAAHYKIHADGNERHAEQLSHIEQHVLLKRLLHLLGVLDEETECKDICEAQAEEHARPHPIAVTTVNGHPDEKQNGVGNGLIKLSGVARRTVNTLKDKRPGHIRNLADDLRVHQIAKPYETCRHGSGYGDIVEHRQYLHAGIAAIEQQRQREAYRAPVAGQSLVARVFPPAIGHEVYRHYHLYEMLAVGKKIVGLVEDAVTKARTCEDAYKTVDKQRVEQFVLDTLLPVEPLHHKICQQQADEPAHGIPSEDAESHQVGIPHYI